jgi:hypothetical protein
LRGFLSVLRASAVNHKSELNGMNSIEDRWVSPELRFR